MVPPCSARYAPGWLTAVFRSGLLTWSADMFIAVTHCTTTSKESRKICRLYQKNSPKRCFGNVNMTSYCNITNCVYPVTITTIRHCSVLEFGNLVGGVQLSSRPGHHHTSARHCKDLWYVIILVSSSSEHFQL